VSNTQSAEKIRDAVRETAQGGKLRYVVLVGDAEPAGALDKDVRSRCVPTHLVKAKINVRWGSEPLIATDNPYADLDGDRVPDVAVGRLTADSKQELAVIVRKILAYERSKDFGPWRRQVDFVAGVGGFGALADSAIEMTAAKLITDGVPAAYSTSMTYGSWRSPYCPDPRRFHQATLARLNQGSLFWVYIGHGRHTSLDRVRVPGATHHILDCSDVRRLRCDCGAPIAVFLACYTGAFDKKEDCLAEEMLRAEGAPVAIVCGSRVTMPYAMATMGAQMLCEYFQRRRPTLGDVLLHTKRSMVLKHVKKSPNRKVIDTLAAVLSPSPDELAAERAEHVLLFNLIGDPLLRLQYPQEVKIKVAEYGTSGGQLKMSGTSPVSGTCTVELVCRRDRTKRPLRSRSRFEPTDEALIRYTDVYRQANDHCWARQTLRVGESDFRARLEIPASAVGPCHVRVSVEGEDGFALGAADVYVRRPEREAAATAE